MSELRHIGKETPRLAAREIVTGRAKFARDLKMPRMLFGKALRSPHPHAKIISIDTSEAENLPGVAAVLTYQNSPDYRLGMPAPHKRFLDSVVHYVGEPVALVAAKTEEIAEEALGLIEVKYEALDPIYEIEESLGPDAPQLFPEFPGNVIPDDFYKNNHFCFLEQEFGDPEKGFGEADIIEEVESHVESGQNPLPPEAPGIIAEWNEDNLTLWGSMSSTGLCKFMSAPVLRLPMSQIRIIPAYVGGSYGSKHLTTCNNAIMNAAALAKATQRPVAVFYSKEEHFACHSVRMNSLARYKIGMKKDGTVTAIKGEWLTDCGALSGEQAMMIAVGLISQPILAKCSNVKITSKIAPTNKVPTGPYRGFGYLENTIHLSNALFRALQKIDLDPVEYFKKNRLQVGDTFYHAWMCAGYEKSAGPDILPALVKGAAEFGWQEKWKGWGKSSFIKDSKVRVVGVGLAGQSDVGEQSSNENVILNFDGTATVSCTATEFGTGTRDVVHKIAAEVLGLPLTHVSVTTPDTLSSPFDWGSTGSRSTYAMGAAVMAAANDAKNKLLEQAALMLHMKPEDLDTKNGMIYVKGNPHIQVPWIAAMGIFRNITGIGNFPGRYNVAVQQVQFIQLEVDLETGKTMVINHLCATDCGKIINPMALKGQLDGYFPGMDLAIREESVWDKNSGRLLNPNMMDYKTRTFNELPDHKIVLLETPPNADPAVPFGAFGAGEPSLAPAIPAITMALYNATGKWFTDYPITPAAILKALGKA